jgi:hypothetical protein
MIPAPHASIQLLALVDAKAHTKMSLFFLLFGWGTPWRSLMFVRYKTKFVVALIILMPSSEFLLSPEVPGVYREPR